MPYADAAEQSAAVRRSHERLIKRRRAQRAAARRRVKEWIESFKRDPCKNCGGTFPPACMDFHHRDPQTKIFEVGQAAARYSRGRIAAEIAKCDLLCANCHRLI